MRSYTMVFDDETLRDDGRAVRRSGVILAAVKSGGCAAREGERVEDVAKEHHRCERHAWDTKYHQLEP